MSKNRKPRHRKPQAGNSQHALPVAPYHGNARFIEVGSAGVPFRQLINIDQITNLRFEEQLEEREIPSENEAMAPTKEVVCVGYIVIICFNANNTSVGFADIGPAMGLYNHLVDQVGDLNVPLSRLPRMEPPSEPSVIEGVDGHPVDPDGPEYFELSEEELAQLENPEIDEDAIADAFDVVEDEPPVN